MIPNDGDNFFIKVWRPITLLNVSYKILTKILSKRIEDLLPKFINPTQTKFLKERYILENILTCWKDLDWAKVLGNNLIMFLIDYEKVYDRIEWGLICTMMDCLRFPN